jgi:hypothetical protein
VQLVLLNVIFAWVCGPLQRASKVGAMKEKNVISYKCEYAVVGQDDVRIMDSLHVVSSKNAVPVDPWKQMRSSEDVF